VVVSVKHIGNAAQGQVAKTILQNIRVFAVNDQWRPAEGKDKSDDSITARTVSLLVTPDEAETIALASDLGHVRLILRNPDDEQVAETQGTEENELLQGRSKSNPKEPTAGKSNGILDWLKQQQPGAQQAAAPAPEPSEHFTMDVLKGDEVSHVEFVRSNKEGRWMSNNPDSNAANAALPAVSVTPSSTPAPTTQPAL
jgi:pilus assembly protein CpaB